MLKEESGKAAAPPPQLWSHLPELRQPQGQQTHSGHQRALRLPSAKLAPLLSWNLPEGQPLPLATGPWPSGWAATAC